MIARLFAVGLPLVLLAPCQSLAQGKAKLARETAEYVMRKFSKEGAQDGIETLARRIETLATSHGDEAILAVSKVGPRTFRLVEEAGEHGLQSVKLMAKYGDDAIWVVAKPCRIAIFVKFGDNAAEAMMKHGEVAELILQSTGRPAAGALKAVSLQNGRRLAMLVEDGQLAKIGRTSELLNVIAKYGDRAMDLVWKQKGSLAASPLLESFLANPEPFLEGTAAIPNLPAAYALEPNAEPVGMTAPESRNETGWTIAAAFAVCIVGLLFAARVWLKSRVSASPS
jgi:hypothetical protein